MVFTEIEMNLTKAHSAFSWFKAFVFNFDRFHDTRPEESLPMYPSLGMILIRSSSEYFVSADMDWV